MKHRPDIFNRFTSRLSAMLGRAWVFCVALGVLIVWGISGPLLGFSDTWQLVINTSTTIVTFLMVFIIQNTQNRDMLALNIKHDVMMKKLGITQEDLLRAEEEGDKYLEKQKKRIEHPSKSAKKRSHA
jgi:low affinity Fe/Cu permease